MRLWFSQIRSNLAMRLLWCIYLPVSIVLLVPSAAAQTPQKCVLPEEVDKFTLLRRLSLDLRGKIPSIEEYEALDKSTDAADVALKKLIDVWIRSSDFAQVIRRYHETMLWPNIVAGRISGARSRLFDASTATQAEALRIASGQRQRRYRGKPYASCGDFEQTRFDPKYPGEFRPHPKFIKTLADGSLQEGWRFVKPYWDPQGTVKVCAFDAQQTALVSVVEQGVSTTIACNTPDGHNVVACGCGANLRYCFPPTSIPVQTMIHHALREQLGKAVDEISVGGKPYTDLILSTKAYQNGVIAFWKTYLAPNVDYLGTVNAKDPEEETISNPNFLDTSWKLLDRKGMHAGVTTLPMFLLRFQTARSRANRFRINFLCEPFVPPAQSNDAPPDCSLTDGDITKRCVCRYCHQTLEPLSKYWGAYAESGTLSLTDRTRFPLKNPACVSNTPSQFCGRFYVTRADAPNAGSLLAYQYADKHPDYVTHIEAGPRAVAQSIIDSGEFAKCAVRRVFLYFLKREIRISGQSTDELALFKTLTEGFIKRNYQFSWLVSQVVQTPQYRRPK